MNRALRRHQYWRRVCQWTFGLLSVWLFVNLAGPWLARDLDGTRVLGYPVAYWVAAHGALLVYLGIIVVYCIVMDRLDRQLLDDEHSDSAGPEQG
jgi:putative solute:sodium symporter small subunit